ERDAGLSTPTRVPVILLKLPATDGTKLSSGSGSASRIATAEPSSVLPVNDARASAATGLGHGATSMPRSPPLTVFDATVVEPSLTKRPTRRLSSTVFPATFVVLPPPA